MTHRRPQKESYSAFVAFVIAVDRVRVKTRIRAILTQYGSMNGDDYELSLLIVSDMARITNWFMLSPCPAAWARMMSF